MIKKDGKKIIKLTILFLLSFLSIFFILSSMFYKKVYFILSKTSLYDTVSLKEIEHEHHDDDEEKELVYFEDEFKNQPYANPLPSSVNLIQLSLSLIILAFVINRLKKTEK